jgi:hypothetical protein
MKFKSIEFFYTNKNKTVIKRFFFAKTLKNVDKYFKRDKNLSFLVGYDRSGNFLFFQDSFGHKNFKK